MTCRQQLSTCQEAVLISKYVYSRPTYLYTNIQTFDNVWLKWLKTTVPRDNSERNNTAARVQHCIQQGKAAVNFSIHTYIHTYTHIYIHTYIYTQNVWYSWFPKILRCGTFNFAASTISSTSRGLRIDTQIEFLKAEGEEAVGWKLEVVGICRSVSKCLGPNFRDFQSASVLGEHHTWDPLEHHWLVIWACLKWWPQRILTEKHTESWLLGLHPHTPKGHYPYKSTINRAI